MKVVRSTELHRQEKEVLRALKLRCPALSSCKDFNDKEKSFLLEYRGPSLSGNQSIWLRNAFLHLVDYLRQMHDAGILHCDIRPANVVVLIVPNPLDSSTSV